MLKVSFLTQLDSRILSLMFSLTYDLNDFKSRVNRHLLYLGSFQTAFQQAFYRFLLLVVIPCLVPAVQPCMECFPVKKITQM